MVMLPVSGCLDEDCLIDRPSMLGCVLNTQWRSHVSGEHPIDSLSIPGCVPNPPCNVSVWSGCLVRDCLIDRPGMLWCVFNQQ